MMPGRKFLEEGFTIGFFLLLMGSFNNLFLGSLIGSEGISTVYNKTPIGLSIVEGLIYGGGALLVLLHYRKVLRGMAAAWPFLLINGMAFVSTAWSVDPGVTFRRSCVLLGTTVLASYMSVRYSTEEFQRVIMRSLLILVAASVVMLVIAPNTVLDPTHSGAMRGLTEHKNPFGEFMGILLLVACTVEFRSKWRYARAGTVVVALTFLVAARSGNAFLSIGVTALFVPVLLTAWFRRRQAVALAVMVGTAMLALVVVVSRSTGSVLDLLGKDRTLTGRTEIWGDVWEAIGRQPLLGYGFDGFWQGLKGPSLLIISHAGWDVPHSHNGYLEALLGFGAVGMGLVVLAVMRTAKDGAWYLRQRRTSAQMWPLLLLLFFLIHATAEASLIKRDGFAYLLVMVVSNSLALRRRRSRHAVSSEEAEHPVLAAAGS